MRFTLPCLVLGFASAAYAAPLTNLAARSAPLSFVNVTFLHEFSGPMFDPPRFRIEPEKAQKLAERALQGLHRTHSWLHPMRIRFLNELIDVPGSEEVDMSFHGEFEPCHSAPCPATVPWGEHADDE
ncbi:hypothetical protein EV359DRAFT_60334 [Lentinula novae-zelandiae]|nr:hypothetical protein EV359DRAFT_60334 [Lentinula novae-zelandiae]